MICLDFIFTIKFMACLGKAMGYIVGQENSIVYIDFHYLTKDITW